MWGAVLLFALAAAQDPVRISVMAWLISRPRPMPNLFSYWLGLMVTGVGAALTALLVLPGLMLPIMRIATSAWANPVVPQVQIVVGVLALSAASVLAASPSVRQFAHSPKARDDHSAVVLEPKAPTLLSRLSFRRLLDGQSLGIAFTAGLCTSTQIIEFWGAMMVIAASRASAGTQVVAALIFTLVAFAFAELPLVSYLVWPQQTHAVIMRLQDRLCVHRRMIFACMLGVFGALMTVKGAGVPL
jgi:hypothetical protein